MWCRSTLHHLKDTDEIGVSWMFLQAVQILFLAMNYFRTSKKRIESKAKIWKKSLNYAMIDFYWTFYCKFFMFCKIWRSNNKSQFVFMYNGFDRVICYTLCTNWRQLHLTHLTRHMPKHAKKCGNMLIIINSIFNCHHT